MEYTWDEKKRRSNLINHDCDFLDAHKVFEGGAPFVSEYQERRAEDRWLGYGRIGRKTIILIYQEFEERIHIISMRSANRRERAYYEINAGQDVGKGDQLTRLIEKLGKDYPKYDEMNDNVKIDPN